jgi:hypothetical protein
MYGCDVISYQCVYNVYLFVAGLSGLITGYLYLNDAMSLQKIRLPVVVGKLFSPFSFFFGPTAFSTLPNGPTPVPPRRPRGAGTGAGAGQQRQGQGQRQGGLGLGGAAGGGGGQHMPPPPPPAPEESIQSLMGLGFERDRVVRALQSRDNNVEAAANFLLSGND